MRTLVLFVLKMQESLAILSPSYDDVLAVHLQYMTATIDTEVIILNSHPKLDQSNVWAHRSKFMVRKSAYDEKLQADPQYFVRSPILIGEIP